MEGNGEQRVWDPGGRWEPELECEILVTVLYSCAGLEPLIKLDAPDDVRKEH